MKSNTIAYSFLDHSRSFWTYRKKKNKEFSSLDVYNESNGDVYYILQYYIVYQSFHNH